MTEDTDRLTVRIVVDEENCLDIRNASMYTGVGTMQLRKMAKAGTLAAVKRTALDDPKGDKGRVKYFVHRDVLDAYMAEREARRAAGGARVTSKVSRIKSVRKMVSEMDIDADRMAVTIETLNDLLQGAIAEMNAKRAEEAAQGEEAAS